MTNELNEQALDAQQHRESHPLREAVDFTKDKIVKPTIMAGGAAVGMLSKIHPASVFKTASDRDKMGYDRDKMGYDQDKMGRP